MLRRFAALAGVIACLGSGCAKQGDVIVETGEGKELSATAIDADPLALLPPNAIGALMVDGKALFTSPFGVRLAGLLRTRAPLPAEAGFEPGRDVERVVLGFYSMQGADVAGVAIGRFDPAAMQRAADATPTTPAGTAVTKSDYVGHSIYVAQDLGFCALTARTLLVGNETGIRRALDRIHEGRVKQELPAWMKSLFVPPAAPIAGGADFTAHPVPAAAREQAVFLDGLKSISLLGNFQDPGLNFAGTLLYDDAAAAARGSDNLQDFRGKLSNYAPFLALFGIPQPIRSLKSEVKDKSVQVMIGVDGAAVAALIEKLSSYLDAQQKAAAAAASARSQ